MKSRLTLAVSIAGIVLAAALLLPASAQIGVGVGVNPSATPDTLYFNGAPKLTTADNGAQLIANAGDTVTTMEFLNAAGSARKGFLTFRELAAGAVELRSETHGNHIVLQGEDTGGTLRALMQIDPDKTANSFTIWGNPYASAMAYVRFDATGAIVRSMNVTSVTNAAGTGAWDVNFAAGVFAAAPVCTCYVSAAGFCYDRATFTSSVWQMSTANTAGTLTDLGANVVCHSNQ